MTGHPAFVPRLGAVDLEIGCQRVRDRGTAFEWLHLCSLLNLAGTRGDDFPTITRTPLTVH